MCALHGVRCAYSGTVVLTGSGSGSAVINDVNVKTREIRHVRLTYKNVSLDGFVY